MNNESLKTFAQYKSSKFQESSERKTLVALCAFNCFKKGLGSGVFLMSEKLTSKKKRKQGKKK